MVPMNKPISKNKHLNSLITHRKWDKVVADLGGPQGCLSSKAWYHWKGGQLVSPKNQGGGCGAHWGGLWNPPKWWQWGDLLVQQGPAALFGGLWGPQKKSQKYRKCGISKFSWGATSPENFKAWNLTQNSQQFLQYLDFYIN